MIFPQEQSHILRCWAWLSLLNWIEALTLSLLLKLPPRKLKPWLALWNSFLLRLLCLSINLPFMHGLLLSYLVWLVLLVASWNFWISYKNRYAGLQVLHLLPLETLAHHWNVASLKDCIHYIFAIVFYFTLKTLFLLEIIKF